MLSEKSNIVRKSKHNIGRAADITIAKMKHQDIASKSEIDTYKRECLSFLLSTTKKLFEKTLLGSSIMHHASCLNPSHITNLASSSESFEQLMNQLVYLKIFPGKSGDKALNQFSNFILNCVKEEPEKITCFDSKKQRIADFYFHSLTNISEHNELCDVLKLIFAISHGQGDVERRFSLNKNFVNQIMEALTITSRRKVKDHLISNKIVLHEFKVPSTFLQYAQSPWQKYEVYLETSRSEKEQDRKSKQIEVIHQEIKDTETLRQQADKKLLEYEFVTCVDKGEIEDDMLLVSKAMAVKRKSTEKQIELGGTNLEEALNVLKEKRKKLL